jgi:AcrR family transcriptional regulator
LVASARELVAREGVEVSVEEITHHAGLGMGTLYRHFPTKDDLLDAVLEESFAEIVAAAEAGANADDAWEGFASFIERTLELHVTNRGLKDIVASREHGASRAEAMRLRLRPFVKLMIERAQEQGALRGDFVPADLPLVFWSAGRVVEKTADVARDSWRRYLGFLLDGLRAPAATPLPAPPLTRGQIERTHRRRA